MANASPTVSAAASADDICAKLDNPGLSPKKINSLLAKCQAAIRLQGVKKDRALLVRETDRSQIQDLPDLVPSEDKIPAAKAEPAGSAVRS